MKYAEILLVDDDENHLFLLKEKLISVGYKNLVLRNTIDEAREYLSYNIPDIILIDYYLDKRQTGIDFIRQFNSPRIPPIIIVSTFFDETILQEIKQFNISDFISKSCTPFELNKCLVLSIAKKQNIEKRELLTDFILVKVGNIVKKVNFIDIEMFEVDGKYLKTHAQGRTYAIRSTLNDIEKRLPANFIKVHQSFIINTDFIEHINLIDHKVKLKTVEAIYSKNYKKTILNSSYLK